MAQIWPILQNLAKVNMQNPQAHIILILNNAVVTLSLQMNNIGELTNYLSRNTHFCRFIVRKSLQLRFHSIRDNALGPPVRSSYTVNILAIFHSFQHQITPDDSVRHFGRWQRRLFAGVGCGDLGLAIFYKCLP